MDAQEIYQKLEQAVPDGLIEFQAEQTKNPTALVKPEAVYEILKTLKTDPELDFDFLECISGFDLGADQSLGIIYHLYSYKKGHAFAVKALLDRAQPEVPSVTDLYRTADWHEREAYDMFGIRFKGHPDLRRILLEDDWEGYPLRKDYVPAETYRGMKIVKDQN